MAGSAVRPADELPANTGGGAIDHAGLSSCDPMEPTEPIRPSFLISTWMSSPGFLTLVAANRLGLQSAQLVQAQSTQNPTDRGRRDADLGRDLLARPALTAQSLDLLNDLQRRRAGVADAAASCGLQVLPDLRCCTGSAICGQSAADAYGECGEASGVCPLSTWRTIRFLDPSASAVHSYGCPFGPPGNHLCRNVSFLRLD